MSAPSSKVPPRAAPARPASGKPAPVPREAIALAFEAVGGVSALAEWVEAHEDNRKIFYATIFPKILSLEPGGAPEREPITEVRRIIVRP